MVLFSPKSRRRRVPVSVILAGMLVMLSLLLAACGGGGGGGTTTGGTTSNALPCSSAANSSAPTPTPIPSVPPLKAPTDLITPGTLTVGSDTTYPPQEFIDTTTGKATGFDVDLITEMAKRLGLKANVKTANFDGSSSI